FAIFRATTIPTRLDLSKIRGTPFDRPGSFLLLKKTFKFNRLERQLRRGTLAGSQMQHECLWLEDHGLQGKVALIDGIELSNNVVYLHDRQILTLLQQRKALALLGDRQLLGSEMVGAGANVLLCTTPHDLLGRDFEDGPCILVANSQVHQGRAFHTP